MTRLEFDQTKVPTIGALQSVLLQQLSKHCGGQNVRLALMDWWSKPTLHLVCETEQAPETFTKSFATEYGLQFIWSKNREKVTFFRDVLHHGRELHGRTSGITVEFATQFPLSERVRFPDSRFGQDRLNSLLEGQIFDVVETAFADFASNQTPTVVDIVYTWVDGSDPEWRQTKQQFTPHDTSADAVDHARFESVEELLFSLRGLFRYFTGVGQVFIVTDNQFPDFLDEFGGRVQVISHDEIMGSKVTRPTYNSHAIESVLYKIKGLCEHYLYLNDDFIIASPTCPADFFTPLGQAKLFYSTRAMIPTGEITDKDLAVDVAAINARQIFKADFDHVISRKFQHAPVATKKSVQQHLAKAFPKAYAATRKNRFRGRTDISPATSFYPHYAMMTGDGVQGHIRYRYYETNNVMLPFKLFKLSSEPARRRPQVLCLNAVGNKPPSARNLKAIQREMNSFLPAAEGRRLNRPWDRLRFHINKLILSGLKRIVSLRKFLRRKLRR